MKDTIILCTLENLKKITKINIKSTYREVEEELFVNFTFATFISRLVYYRSNFKKFGFKSLNEIDEVSEMARVWKAIYNTEYGKGKESEFIENYYKYDLDKYDINYYNVYN